MPHNKSRLMLSLLSGFAAFLISQSVIAGFVDLEVVESDGDVYLDIVSNEHQCGTDKYCIKTTKGEAQDLDFRLKQACTPNGPQYRLTGMQFSMIQREPDGAGGMVKAFGKYVIPAVAVQDFNTDARGNVQFTRSNKLSDHMIQLRNENTGEYVIFFQIEAEHCDDSSVKIYLDPRIENQGR